MSLLDQPALSRPAEEAPPAASATVDTDRHGKEHGVEDRTDRPLLSVVVPVCNEALMLKRSLTELYLYLQRMSDRYDFELIIVDDGSEDESALIAEAFATTRPEVVLLRQPHNFGVGQALRYGFGQSRGDYVVAFDSDLSYSPDHIERLVTALRTQRARIVVASPYMKGGETSGIPWRREAMSKGINRILSYATRHDVHTVTGMVRAYDGIFLRSLNLRSMGPEINTEILYKAQILRARVIEIAAHLDWRGQEERNRSRKVSFRVSTTSKLLTFSTFLFRPFVWFVVPGILLLLVALSTLGSVAFTVLDFVQQESGNIDQRLYDAFAHAWAVRPHSFIIGGFSFVIATILITGGLISAQVKRYFEELFHFNTSLSRSQQHLEESIAAVGTTATNDPPDER